MVGFVRLDLKEIGWDVPINPTIIHHLSSIGVEIVHKWYLSQLHIFLAKSLQGNNLVWLYPRKKNYRVAYTKVPLAAYYGKIGSLQSAPKMYLWIGSLHYC